MKDVFNKLLVAALLCAGFPGSGNAQVYFSVRGLLAEQFKQSELVDYRRIELSARTRDHVEQQLG